MTDSSGSSGSISSTTTTGGDHSTTILPVWFNTDGHPVFVVPISISGPPGIVPPPLGFPPVIIGPDGSATPEPGSTPSPTVSPTSVPTSPPSVQTPSPTSTSPTGTGSGSTSSSSTSSSSSTATPTGYGIFPQQNASTSDKDQLQSFLQTYGDDIKLKTIGRTNSSVCWWTANLNSTQQDQVKQNPLVRKVLADTPLQITLDRSVNLTSGSRSRSDKSSPVREKRAIISQIVAVPPELRVVSQAPGTPIPDAFEYDDSAGAGVTVYVLDTGAEPGQPEYQQMAGHVEWMQMPFTQNTEDDFNGHGSCVLSLIAGPTFGTAKRANVVIVKIVETAALTILARDLLTTFSAIFFDISDYNQNGKAVINVSWGSVQDSAWTEEIGHVVNNMVSDLDVPVIVAAGNEGNDQEPDKLPATFGPLEQGVFVVGSTNNAGVMSEFSNYANWMSIWAPGENILCSTNDPQRPTAPQSGTSMATAKVSGVAAYFLGYPGIAWTRGQVVAQLRQIMVNQFAWARDPNSPNIKVVYNGASTGRCLKRDGSCSTSITPSNTTLSTSTNSGSGTGSSSSSSQTNSTTKSGSLSSPAPATTTTTSGGSSPAPTRGVDLYAAYYFGNAGPAGGLATQWWAEVDTMVGVGTGLNCDKKTIEGNTLSMPPGSASIDYPKTWAFQKPVQSLTSCTYINDAAPNPATGTLKCPDLPTPAACPNVTLEQWENCNSGDAEGDSYRRIAHCDF